MVPAIARRVGSLAEIPTPHILLARIFKTLVSSWWKWAPFIPDPVTTNAYRRRLMTNAFPEMRSIPVFSPHVQLDTLFRMASRTFALLRIRWKWSPNSKFLPNMTPRSLNLETVLYGSVTMSDRPKDPWSSATESCMPSPQGASLLVTLLLPLRTPAAHTVDLRKSDSTLPIGPLRKFSDFSSVVLRPRSGSSVLCVTAE